MSASPVVLASQASPRPLIGLFTGVRPPLEALPPLRLRAVAAEAMVQNANFMVFSSTDVDLDCETIRGTALEVDAWGERLYPFPDVVINPIAPRNDLDLAVEQALRRCAPFTTRRIANKIGIAEIMKGTPLQPHVIPYEPLDADRLEPQVARFLAAHRRVVAKPAKGRRGQHIMFLTADPAGALVRWHTQESVLPMSAVAERLLPLTAEEPWLLQRFVMSRARGDRYFDVRVHVHKNGTGAWSVVRAYVRLSEGGLMVSNTSRGGYQGDINHFFASLKKDGPLMVERLCRIGLEVGHTLDRHYGGGLDELGVDLLVDEMRHPWLAEVNSHPQSRYHEFERARCVVDYARHLARGGMPPGAPAAFAPA